MPIDFKALQHDIFAYVYLISELYNKCTRQGSSLKHLIFQIINKVFAIIALAYIGI